MPTYEYRCPDGHDFERFYRKISDALRGRVSGVRQDRRRVGCRRRRLVFKGSGFYLTDYGKNAHRKSGARDRVAAKRRDEGEIGRRRQANRKPVEANRKRRRRSGGKSKATAKSEASERAKPASPRRPRQSEVRQSAASTEVRRR